MLDSGLIMQCHYQVKLAYDAVKISLRAYSIINGRVLCNAQSINYQKFLKSRN